MMSLPEVLRLAANGGQVSWRSAGLIWVTELTEIELGLLDTLGRELVLAVQSEVEIARGNDVEQLLRVAEELLLSMHVLVEDRAAN